MYIHSAQHNTRCKTSENRTIKIPCNLLSITFLCVEIGAHIFSVGQKIYFKKKLLTTCAAKTLETVVKTPYSICALVLFAFCKRCAFKDIHFTFSLNKIRKALNVLEPIICCSPGKKKLSLLQLVLKEQQCL